MNPPGNHDTDLGRSESAPPGENRRCSSDATDSSPPLSPKTIATAYQSGLPQAGPSSSEETAPFSKHVGKQEDSGKDERRTSVEEDLANYVPNLKKSSASSAESDEIIWKKNDQGVTLDQELESARRRDNNEDRSSDGVESQSRNGEARSNDDSKCTEDQDEHGETSSFATAFMEHIALYHMESTTIWLVIPYVLPFIIFVILPIIKILLQAHSGADEIHVQPHRSPPPQPQRLHPSSGITILMPLDQTWSPNFQWLGAEHLHDAPHRYPLSSGSPEEDFLNLSIICPLPTTSYTDINHVRPKTPENTWMMSSESRSARRSRREERSRLVVVMPIMANHGGGRTMRSTKFREESVKLLIEIYKHRQASSECRREVVRLLEWIEELELGWGV